jgi:hypothetical protein
VSDTKHLDTQIEMAENRLTKYESMNPIMYHYWVEKIKALKEKRDEIHKNNK